MTRELEDASASFLASARMETGAGSSWQPTVTDRSGPQSSATSPAKSTAPTSGIDMVLPARKIISAWLWFCRSRWSMGKPFSSRHSSPSSSRSRA